MILSEIFHFLIIVFELYRLFYNKLSVLSQEYFHILLYIFSYISVYFQLTAEPDIHIFISYPAYYLQNFLPASSFAASFKRSTAKKALDPAQ